MAMKPDWGYAHAARLHYLYKKSLQQTCLKLTTSFKQINAQELRASSVYFNTSKG